MTPKTINNVIRTAFTFLLDDHSLTEQYSEKRVEFAFSAYARMDRLDRWVLSNFASKAVNSPFTCSATGDYW